MDVVFSTGSCQCGRDYAWHEQRNKQCDRSKIKWKPEQHTVEIDADTVGTIRFSGFGTDNPNFAPVDHSVRNIRLPGAVKITFQTYLPGQATF